MTRKTEQMAYGANTFIQILLVLGIVIAVNALPRTMKAINVFGARIPLQKEWDVTKNKAFSLSEQTQKVLTTLEKPITAVLFVQKGSQDEQQLKPLLERFAFYSGKFTYRIEDPDRNPMATREYGVKQLRTLVLESGGQRQTIILPWSQETGPVESKITSGLLQAINPKKSVVYFTTGHGEMDASDMKPNGLANLKADMEGEGYEVKPLTLALGKSIPEDASVVVVAGGSKDFFPGETEVLEKYLQRGGRILWLANLVLEQKGAAPLPNVTKFLKGQGVDATHMLVISDQTIPLNAVDRFLIPSGIRYDAHPITEGFTNTTATYYLAPQALKVGKAPEGGVVQPLVWTGDDTYEYANALKAAQVVMQAQKASAAFNPTTDTKGAALLGVAGTYKAPEKPSPAASPAASPAPAAEKATEGRMVVFGNSGFVSNRLVRLGSNEDIMLNSLAWLAERTAQISAERPKEQAGPITLDDATKDRLIRIGFPLVPCLIGLAGVLVHIVFKRR